ncbi:DUF1837 domain-containing protein [Leptospira montravelensis]|uniref:DUF1837 domain-containing protein n=1 Tax=Leptospira montravelensis TaxID=2484961 RepID=A0ABY2LRA1_9LEPT|nr:DUF1837 domain-containing protein [Leptospira montravelensis]TGK77536.1 DUF1837 domain-containing protein [Leptospira montravelensis]TGL02603.1 DUF1837 domain-containing protein [Leptospira montravelensis]
MKKTNINQLLSNTEALFAHVYMFTEKFDILPDKEHYGTSIAYTDIRQRKDDFIRELKNSITSWVYNSKKAKELFNERLDKTEDLANSASFLANLALSKFRPNQPQGQFGELILFNFIQHIFEAPPLLRKMPITTSTGHERFGADAIHYREKNGSNEIILGESKCYESKYKFNDAFLKSLISIENSFNNIDNELHLYIHDDFIDSQLVSIAKSYKSNSLNNVKYELVCIIIYNETNSMDKLNSQIDLENEIKSIIRHRCSKIDKQEIKRIKENVLDRIHYIIFPVWNLDEILNSFK